MTRKNVGIGMGEWDSELLTESERQIISYAEKLGLKASVNAGYIAVQSKVGMWRIFMKEDFLIKAVYHGNYRFSRGVWNRSDEMQREFHKQDMYSEDVFYVLKYIAKHDYFWLQPHSGKTKKKKNSVA